tara:strand:+ start:347 stop:673 length:327 start_codon:yes stop_codon:yes gene_type:complete
MIGGRKVRSNKGKRRGSYKAGKTRSGTPFRGRKVTSKRNVTKRPNQSLNYRNNLTPLVYTPKKTRKVRSNKGKRRGSYKTGKTRSGKKFRGGFNGIRDIVNKIAAGFD